MILNERQYRVTKAAEARIAKQIEDLERDGVKDLRSRQRELLVKAAKEQLQEFRREIEEFDALRKGATAIAPIGSIEELPLALIRARIARGWTQASLADQLGVAEQQVQRDEANAYRSASFERIRRITEVLGVRLRGVLQPVYERRHARPERSEIREDVPRTGGLSDAKEERPSADERFVRIPRKETRELADLMSRYEDLSFVIAAGQRLLTEMAGRQEDIVVLRALWSSMVIDYGRAFTTGKLRFLPRHLVSRLVGRWPKNHEALMHRRDRQIAHAVDEKHEELIFAVGYRSNDETRTPHSLAFLGTRQLAPAPDQVSAVIRHAEHVRKEVAALVEEYRSRLKEDLGRKASVPDGEDVTSVLQSEDFGEVTREPLPGFRAVNRPRTTRT